MSRSGRGEKPEPPRWSGYQRLADLLTERGWGERTRLADELSVDDSLVTKWTTGSRQPWADQLERICRRYDVRADYLLCFTDVRRLSAATVAGEARESSDEQKRTAAAEQIARSVGVAVMSSVNELLKEIPDEQFWPALEELLGEGRPNGHLTLLVELFKIAAKQSGRVERKGRA